MNFVNGTAATRSPPSHRMSHHHRLSATAIAASMLALSTPVAAADVDRYPSPAQQKQVRAATLYLTADGAFAHLDEAEWCEEVEQFLKERGFKSARQHHRQVVTEVAVDLPAAAFRNTAVELVRLVGRAPAPLSRFKARFEVRRFDNTLVTARYDGEQWKEAHESRPDPIPFTRKLMPGQWMMSVEQGQSGGFSSRQTRISLWDKEGEANAFELQAILATPNGELHRSKTVPWMPAGVETNIPADFPTLQGKKLPHGTYRVIYEADGKTIDWPRSLPFEL